MTADALLSRLDGVKQTGPDRWIAKCPSHADKNPSLAIRETDDGRVLIHCFAGCSTEEVLNVIGMKFDDLFPDRAIDHRVKPERRPFPATDVLRCLVSEAMTTAAIGRAMLSGAHTEVGQARLVESVSRIQSAATFAGVSP